MALYRPLSKSERDQVEAGVLLAARLLDVAEIYAVDQLQDLYDTLLTSADSDDRAVDALGYAFGSLMLRQEWLGWAMLSDEFGSEISVAVQDRALGCSPLSMLRNRLSDGTPCDLAELLETTEGRLRQLGQHSA